MLQEYKANDKKKLKPMTDRVYTPDEIRSVFFPRNLIGDKQYEFISQKDNVEMFVPACVCPLNTAVHIRDGDGFKMITQVDFGSYRVRFVDKRYITKNILEYRAIYNKPGTVCVREITAIKVPRAEKVVKGKKGQAEDEGQIPTL